MAQNILLTGVSGYLGGSLLTRLRDEPTALPPHGTIYALVRTEEQAKAVKDYGAEPLFFNPRDASAVEANVLEKRISVVFWLIDAANSEAQIHFIEALAKLKQQTGVDGHLLHTTGAKIFSSLMGAPTDRPLLDTDPELYEVQKAQRAPIPPLQQPVDTNNAIIESSEKLGVRSYIFAPCIVYGRGQGFGNPVSIQTVAIVKAAKAARKVYRVDANKPTWPVCHIDDNTSLYIRILSEILAGSNPGHGKQGYYLASSGSVAWDDIYARMAVTLAKRGVVDDENVGTADDAALGMMAQGLECPKQIVHVQLGGYCTFTARHGAELGWAAQYPPEHILDAAEEEVDLILKHI